MRKALRTEECKIQSMRVAGRSKSEASVSEGRRERHVKSGPGHDRQEDGSSVSAQTMLLEEAKRGLCTGFYINPTLRDPDEAANKHRKSKIFPFHRATLIFPGENEKANSFILAGMRICWEGKACVGVYVEVEVCPSFEHQISTLQGKREWR